MRDFWENDPHHSSYLGVLQARQIWLQVIDDTLIGSGKRDASNQKDDQHQVGKRGCEINNLGGKQVKVTSGAVTAARRCQGPAVVFLSTLPGRHEPHLVQCPTPERHLEGWTHKLSAPLIPRSCGRWAPSRV